MKNIALLATLLFLAGCNPTPLPRSDILGKWSSLDASVTPNERITIEFFESGDFKLVMNSIPGHGKYSFVDDTHIRLPTDSPIITKIKIDGDTMVMTSEDGKKARIGAA